MILQHLSRGDGHDSTGSDAFLRPRCGVCRRSLSMLAEARACVRWRALAAPVPHCPPAAPSPSLSRGIRALTDTSFLWWPEDFELAPAVAAPQHAAGQWRSIGRERVGLPPRGLRRSAMGRGRTVQGAGVEGWGGAEWGRRGDGGEGEWFIHSIRVGGWLLSSWVRLLTVCVCVGYCVCVSV